MTEDSSMLLISALNNQIEISGKKIYELESKLKSLESENDFLYRKIYNTVKLLRDHEDGFSADAYLRRDHDQDVAFRDCEIASKVCKDVADILESKEEYIY